jgi:hypothetical protein
MDPGLIAYYVGYAAALVLCFQLGPIFYGPMLANLAFNVSLSLGAFSGWDVRWVLAFYGLGMFIWVLVLAGSVNNITVVLLVLLDVGMIGFRLFPLLAGGGTGEEFWITASTGIIDVWTLSVFTVVGSTLLRSSLGARIRGEPTDLWTNPRRRFLLPLGAWSAMIVIPQVISPDASSVNLDYRFSIAALMLVWGWVAVELPFFLMYWRIHRRHG